MASIRGSAREHVPCEFSCSFLFCHEEEVVAEERFIELHDPFQDMGFLREMCAESAIPSPHAIIRTSGERARLFDGNPRGPRPEEYPHELIRKLDVRKPRMREKRETDTARYTAIPSLSLHDPTTFADRTEHVLPEYDTTEIFLNFCLRRYLIEGVHALHSSKACANRLRLPEIFFYSRKKKIIAIIIACGTLLMN